MVAIPDYNLLDTAFKSVGLPACIRDGDVGHELELLNFQIASSFETLLRTLAWPKNRQRPGIHLGFVMDLTLNAIAFKHQGSYFIGLNVAVPIILRNIFYTLLSDARVFPEVAYPNAMSRPVKPLSVGPDYDIAAQVVKPPRDAIRVFMADYLVALVVHLVLIHEAHHIIGGHVGFIGGRYGYARITEMVQRRPSAGECAVRQALEFDADFRATVSIVKDMQSSIERKGAPPYAETPDRAAKSFLFAAYVLTQLFESREHGLEDWQYWNHPPSYVRKTRMIGWAIERLLPPATQKQALASSLPEFALVDLLCSRLDGPGGADSANKDLHPEMAQRIISDIDTSNLETWKAIENEVRKYALI